MPPELLGERKGFADKAPEVLAEGVVPALHVRRLSALLADTPMGFLGEDCCIGLPEVAEAVALAVSPRQVLQRSRQVRSLCSPLAKATIGRVLRHIMVQSQRLFLRRRTKEHSLSSSRTSPASAGNRVASTRGRFASLVVALL